MNILIFCALQEEASPIASALGLKRDGPKLAVYQGSYSTHQIRLIVTGMGRKNAQRACEQYFIRPLPDLITSCGYAGGLDPRLKVGDVTLARKILLCDRSHETTRLPTSRAKPGEDSARLVEILVELKWGNFGKVLEALTRGVYVGTHLTWMGVVDRAEKKKELGQRFGAMAVDMESGFIAKSLSPYAIPFLNLRVISDSCEENVEIDFSPYVTAEGSVRLGLLLRYLIRHPGKLRYFLKVSTSSRRALRKLAGVLKRMIEQLPSS